MQILTPVQCARCVVQAWPWSPDTLAICSWVAVEEGDSGAIDLLKMGPPAQHIMGPGGMMPHSLQSSLQPSLPHMQPNQNNPSAQAVAAQQSYLAGMSPPLKCAHAYPPPPPPSGHLLWSSACHTCSQPAKGLADLVQLLGADQLASVWFGAQSLHILYSADSCLAQRVSVQLAPACHAEQIQGMADCLGTCFVLLMMWVPLTRSVAGLCCRLFHIAPYELNSRGCVLRGLPIRDRPNAHEHCACESAGSARSRVQSICPGLHVGSDPAESTRRLTRIA